MVSVLKNYNPPLNSTTHTLHVVARFSCTSVDSSTVYDEMSQVPSYKTIGNWVIPSLKLTANSPENGFFHTGLSFWIFQGFPLPVKLPGFWKLPHLGNDRKIYGDLSAGDPSLRYIPMEFHSSHPPPVKSRTSPKVSTSQ